MLMIMSLLATVARKLSSHWSCHISSQIVRTTDVLDHPAVIGMVNTSRNPERMKKLQAGTDKAVVTCFSAEYVGTGLDSDPCKAWERAKPKIRTLRIHPFKGGVYDLTRQPDGETPLAQALAMARSSFDTPWWAVLQAFGGDTPGADYNNPTPAQIRAQTHLALAYGAKGILYYSFQRDAGGQGMVDHVSLKPLDEKLKTVSELAALIASHADLIKSLKGGGLDVRCPSPFVEAVGQRGKDDKRYVYVVNKDTKNPVTTKLLLWADRWEWTSARDVFNGKGLEVKQRDKEGCLSVSLTLAPGEGQLLATDVTDRSR